MTPITSASPATAPDAIIAIPAHHSAHRGTGPLRSGNPRGNPNLAPRCGARARTTSCPCRAPAMPNGRCRMHGGKSTGPRTPEGFASLARTHTKHGLYAQTGPEAELRAEIHHARVVARRVRLSGAAFDLLSWLPPAFAARLRADTATELHAPPDYARLQTLLAATAPKPTDHPPATATLQPPGHTPHPRRDARGKFAPPPPCPLRGRQAERAQARAEAAALASWKLAIAQARTAMRQAQTAKRAKPQTDLVPSDQEKSAPAPACPPPQNARFASPRIIPMNPETALPPATPAETADASCAKTPIQRGTVAPPARPDAPAGEASAKSSIQRPPPGACPGGGAGDCPLPQNARFANPRIIPMNPETGPPGPIPPGQIARFANPRINPMNPETALPPATPAEPSCAKTAIQRGTVVPPAGPGAAAGESFTKTSMQPAAALPPTTPAEAADASCAKTAIHSLPPGACRGGGTVAPPTAPAEAADASCAKTPIQRGTVAPPARPDAAASEASAKTSAHHGTGGRTATSPAASDARAAPDLRTPAPPAATQPDQPARKPLGKSPIQSLPPGACPGGGTVAAGANPFRNALLASTVSNTPEAHDLAAKVERAGGWPVIIASHAATQAGQDWRPAATAARQRLADDAIRARTRCILRLGPLADPLRTDRPPQGLSCGAT